MASRRIAAPPIAPAPTPPQAREPSQDMSYMLHAFEPAQPLTLGNWDVGTIRAARDEHFRGDFSRSAILAERMLVDGKIFSALSRRIGPALGIPREVTAPKRWNGKGLGEIIRSEVADLFSDTSTAASAPTLTASHAAQTMLGPSILQNVWTALPDGSRLVPEVRPWPMASVTWNEALHRYQAQTLGEGLVTIEPNDGKWIVIEPWGPRSFRFGALLPLALLWADRAYAQRDRSNHSAAHGSISIIGTMPPELTPNSPEGVAFRAMLRLLQQARSGLVKPNGSSVEAFEPKTLAWQIFQQIVNSAGGDIDLILCGIGTDSSVYKSIPQLDGVRYDLAKLDILSNCYALHAGLVVPYVRYNFDADPDLVPGLHGLIPDPRQQARIQAIGEQHDAFARSLTNYRKAGIKITTKLVASLAARFDVDGVELANVGADGEEIPPEPLPQAVTVGGRSELAEEHAEQP